jgi:hypothetical protein
MNLFRLLANSGFLHPHRMLLGVLHAVMVTALVENAAADDTLVTVANPGYNTDRGPVNVFAGRLHWQF